MRGVFLRESHGGGNATKLVWLGSIVGVQGQGEGVPHSDIHHRRAVEPTLLCDLQPGARGGAFAEAVSTVSVISWFVWPFGNVAANAKAILRPCRRGAL